MGNRFRGPLMIAVALVVIVATLVGCAAAPPSLNTTSSESAPKAGAVAPAAAARSNAPAAAPAAGGAPGAPVPAPSVGPGGSSDSAMALDRMIIRTGNLILVVQDVEAAISSVRDITQAAGGFLASSNSRYEGELMVADVTIQVPAQTYDVTIQRLRSMAVRVDSEKSSTQDVTEEYADLDAQLRNLQATEVTLLKMMDKATQMSDILAVQRELTNIRGQIERLQGRMKYLSRRSDMSTITLSLIPEAKSKKKPPEGWNPLRSLRESFGGSFDVLRGLVDALIIIVGYTWWLWIIIGLVVWFIRRRMSRKPPVPPVPPIPPQAYPPS
jgi:hypothetical protein